MCTLAVRTAGPVRIYLLQCCDANAKSPIPIDVAVTANVRPRRARGLNAPGAGFRGLRIELLRRRAVARATSPPFCLSTLTDRPTDRDDMNNESGACVRIFP